MTILVAQGGPPAPTAIADVPVKAAVETGPIEDAAIVTSRWNHPESGEAGP